MTKSLMGALLAAALLAAAGQTRAAPVEAYGRLPDVEDVSLSPDGSRLAFVGSQAENQTITVTRVGAQQAEEVFNTGAAKLRRLAWIDDNDLLIVSSATSEAPVGFLGQTSERASGFVYDLRAHKLTQLSPPDYSRALDQIVGRPFVRVVNGRAQVFFVCWTYQRNHGQPLSSLYVYDVATRETRLVDRGADFNLGYVADSAGEPVAENIYDGRHWMVRVKVNGGWRHLPTVDIAAPAPSMAGLDPQGKAVLFFGDIEGKNGWHALSLETGTWVAAPYAGTTLLTDGQSGLAFGLVRENERKTYSFFAPEMQQAWDKILRAFPGEQVDFVSMSADHKRVVAQVFGQKDGAVYMLVDLASGHVDPIADLYHEIAPEQVAPIRSISYQAADGLRIPAYLTLPRDRPAKALPLVVLPHGGPRDRDDLAFDWMAQALASRGYAVLQPEYRGSRMGRDFAEAGFGQWGRKMQTDLSDGVRFLASQGMIDAKRVCIAGAGYGGYAALAGVTLDPGVYRCAVDFSGQSDLKRMVQWSAARNWTRVNATIAYWDRYMQAEGAHDASYADISPIDHVASIAAPVLIIHGRDDTVVPFEQSQLMVDAMKAAGKPVEFLSLNGEDHWLSRSQTREQMLTAMVRFIETNNPADPPAAVASASR